MVDKRTLSKEKLLLQEVLPFMLLQIFLLHKNSPSTMQDPSFHWRLSWGYLSIRRRMLRQSSLFLLSGCPSGQNVAFQGVQSVHFQTPSSSMSLPPIQIQAQSKFFLVKPSKTNSLMALVLTVARWPPSPRQKSSAAVQFFFSSPKR